MTDLADPVKDKTEIGSDHERSPPLSDPKEGEVPPETKKKKWEKFPRIQFAMEESEERSSSPSSSPSPSLRTHGRKIKDATVRVGKKIYLEKYAKASTFVNVDSVVANRIGEQRFVFQKTDRLAVEAILMRPPFASHKYKVFRMGHEVHAVPMVTDCETASAIWRANSTIFENLPWEIRSGKEHAFKLEVHLSKGGKGTDALLLQAIKAKTGTEVVVLSIDDIHSALIACPSEDVRKNLLELESGFIQLDPERRAYFSLPIQESPYGIMIHEVGDWKSKSALREQAMKWAAEFNKYITHVTPLIESRKVILRLSDIGAANKLLTKPIFKGPSITPIPGAPMKAGEVRFTYQRVKKSNKKTKKEDKKEDKEADTSAAPNPSDKKTKKKKASPVGDSGPPKTGRDQRVAPPDSPPVALPPKLTEVEALVARLASENASLQEAVRSAVENIANLCKDYLSLQAMVKEEHSYFQTTIKEVLGEVTRLTKQNCDLMQDNAKLTKRTASLAEKVEVLEKKLSTVEVAEEEVSEDEQSAESSTEDGGSSGEEEPVPEPETTKKTKKSAAEEAPVEKGASGLRRSTRKK